MEKTLPAIPSKRYFTIGEVSELCGVKPYVLRYWEQEFSQLKPMKRRGNRRYYQRHEVLLIRRIRELLYDEGFTISGARNRLADLPLARTSDTDWGGLDADEGDTTELDAEVESDATAQVQPKLDAVVASATLASLSSSAPQVQATRAAAVHINANATVTAPLGPAPLAGEQLRNELLSIRDLLSP